MKKLDGKKNYVMMVLLCVLLCGCAEAQDSGYKNGIAYAVPETDGVVQEILQEENLADFEKIYSSFTAQPYADAVRMEKVEEIFFSDGYQIVEEQTNSEVETQGADRAVYTAMKMQGAYTIESPDGNLRFCRTADAGLTFENNALMSSYKQTDFAAGCLTETNVDISEEFTSAEAKQQMLEVMSTILDMPIAVFNCVTTHDGQGNGYYDFYIAPQLEGYALAINDLYQDDDRFVDVSGHVIIGKDGIAGIEAYNFLWQTVSYGEKEDCLSLEQIQELLEHYIEEGKVKTSAEVTFENVEIVWMPTTNDWSTAEMIPVWRFYIPAWERMTLGNNVFMEQIPLDICINAVDGEIVRLQ